MLASTLLLMLTSTLILTLTPYPYTGATCYMNSLLQALYHTNGEEE